MIRSCLVLFCLATSTAACGSGAKSASPPSVITVPTTIEITAATAPALTTTPTTSAPTPSTTAAAGNKIARQTALALKSCQEKAGISLLLELVDNADEGLSAAQAACKNASAELTVDQAGVLGKTPINLMAVHIANRSLDMAKAQLGVTLGKPNTTDLESKAAAWHDEFNRLYALLVVA